jgi:hypothetical protein
MKRKEKLASAMAGAITAYIRLEEEASAQKLARVRGGINSLWGVSARQDTMQLKRLYQMRFPKK